MTTMQPRATLLMDAGWKFHLGDIPSPVPNTHIAAYMANKAGWFRGAAKGNFDDSDWRSVDLPHDWSVEGEFDRHNHIDAGFLPRGICWYRRHFRLEESDRGKYLALQFDGIATHVTVYVNGHLLARNFCGYTPLIVEISDVANFGDQPNVVAVRVDATHMEGWWYECAGIYRHVWLIKTSRLHVAPYGVFVQPKKKEHDAWETWVETTVVNDSDLDQSCKVVSEIFDPEDRLAGHTATAVRIPPRSSMRVVHFITVNSPKLWSLTHPHLHRLNTRLRFSDESIDRVATTFGFRTIRFDPDQGFFLNDQPVKLKGTCNHQDHAGLGVALPDAIHRFRIRRLLEMGSNAYRCAHNPPAPELLDACDQLGMLVMDENRNFGSSPEHLDQLRTMVLRDRNHPSVILWSICNEEPIQGTAVGANIARTMQQFVKQLDPSRPVTAAVSGGILDDNCIADTVEIMGINYQLSTYEPYHKKHPGTPLLASETHCALTTRGIYQTDPKRQVFDSYDEQKAFWGTTARQAWAAISRQPFVAGLFAWTGFDYRGEPSPHDWPSINSHWGILDTCGFPKDSFFLHKAFFTQQPFVHLLPHWNWAEMENQPIRVAAYSNCSAVELFLNGESLGKMAVDPIDMVEWMVPYRPGELRAVGFDGESQVAEASVLTSDQAVAIGLEIEPAAAAGVLPADGECAIPITVFALDNQGRRVPTAGNFISFSISAPGRILGVGNGDPNCHEPDKAQERSLFQGLAQVIIQTTTVAGTITLEAAAPGLRSASLVLQSVADTPRPSVPLAHVRYFIEGWRMSRITADRPDPHQAIPEQDMNSWEAIDPANGPQKKWEQAVGYAVYRSSVRLPKSMQPTGGRMIFEKLIGVAQVYIQGIEVGRKEDPSPGKLEIPVSPSSEKRTVSVLIQVDTFPAGIAHTVELLAFSQKKN
jgi:beta-galactosidase